MPVKIYICAHTYMKKQSKNEHINITTDSDVYLHPALSIWRILIHWSIHTCLFLYTHTSSACTFLLLAKILPVVSCNFSLYNYLTNLKQVSLFSRQS